VAYLRYCTGIRLEGLSEIMKNLCNDRDSNRVPLQIRSKSTNHYVASFGYQIPKSFVEFCPFRDWLLFVLPILTVAFGNVFIGCLRTGALSPNLERYRYSTCSMFHICSAVFNIAHRLFLYFLSSFQTHWDF
jgi:hypothetical protein